MNSLDLVPLVLLGSAVIFGPLTSWMAARRERSPVTWFVLGAVAGIFALVVLLLAPPGRCPRCDAPVAGWPDACSTCGTPLGGIFSDDSAGPPPRPRRSAMATPVADATGGGPAASPSPPAGAGPAPSAGRPRPVTLSAVPPPRTNPVTPLVIPSSRPAASPAPAAAAGQGTAERVGATRISAAIPVSSVPLSLDPTPDLSEPMAPLRPASIEEPATTETESPTETEAAPPSDGPVLPPPTAASVVDEAPEPASPEPEPETAEPEAPVTPEPEAPTAPEPPVILLPGAMAAAAPPPVDEVPDRDASADASAPETPPASIPGPAPVPTREPADTERPEPAAVPARTPRPRAPRTTGAPKARVGSRLRSTAPKPPEPTPLRVQDSAGAAELLATALFVSGSRDCQPGMHYLLTLRGGALAVLGPLESAPTTVAAERPLDRVRVMAYGDGLLVSDATSATGWTLGFSRLTGGTPEGVEQALLAAGARPGIE